MRKMCLIALFVILTGKVYASSGGDNNYPERYSLKGDDGRGYSISYLIMAINNGLPTEVRINNYSEIGTLLFTLLYNTPLPSNFPNRFIASGRFCQPVQMPPVRGYNRYSTALTDEVYDAILSNNPNFSGAIRVYIDPEDNTLDIMIRNNVASTEEAEAIEMIANYLGHDTELFHSGNNIREYYSEYFSRHPRRRENEHNGTNNGLMPTEVNVDNIVIITTNPANRQANGEEETNTDTTENNSVTITPLLFRLLMGGGSL